MSIIKPKRGTGSPAGSIETNEIAMDTAAKILYVSTNGTDAVKLADDTKTFLADDAYFLRDYSGAYPQTVVLGNNTLKVDGGSRTGLVLKTGAFAGNTSLPFRIDAVSLDLDGNPIVNVLDPVNAQEAATKNYVDTTSALNLPLAGGTMSGDIDMDNNAVLTQLRYYLTNHLTMVKVKFGITLTMLVLKNMLECNCGKRMADQLEVVIIISR